MNHNLVKILSVFTLMAFSATSAIASPASGDRRLSDDYAVADYSHQPAGKMLKKTRVEGNYNIADADVVYKVLYTAVDGVNGELRTNSGLIFLPAGKAPKEGWPVVSWQHGTTGTADSCAPSWMGPDQPSKVVISSWLKQGFAVVAADYQGLGTTGIHPYLESKPLAYSVLDLLKASVTADLALQNNIVLHGWSEGAMATIAAAQYAPSYAPKLNISGAAASGAPYITPETLSFLATDKVDSAAAVSYITYVLNSTSQLYKNINKDDIFTEDGKAFVMQYGDYCVDDLGREAKVNGTQLEQITKNTLFENKLLIEKTQYPLLKAEIPIFMSIGGNDIDVPANMQLALQQKLCSEGINLSYKLYAGADHTDTLIESIQDSVAFLTTGAEDDAENRPNTLSCLK